MAEDVLEPIKRVTARGNRIMDHLHEEGWTATEAALIGMRIAVAALAAIDPTRAGRRDPALILEQKEGLMDLLADLGDGSYLEDAVVILLVLAAIASDVLLLGGEEEERQ